MAVIYDFTGPAVLIAEGLAAKVSILRKNSAGDYVQFLYEGSAFKIGPGYDSVDVPLAGDYRIVCTDCDGTPVFTTEASCCGGDLTPVVNAINDLPGVSCADPSFTEICNPTDVSNPIVAAIEALDVSPVLSGGADCTDPLHTSMCNPDDISTPINAKLDEVIDALGPDCVNSIKTQMCNADDISAPIVAAIQANAPAAQTGVNCTTPTHVSVCNPSAIYTPINNTLDDILIAVKHGESCGNSAKVDLCDPAAVSDPIVNELTNQFTNMPGHNCTTPMRVQECNPLDLTDVENKLDGIIAAVENIDPEIEDKLDTVHIKLGDILTEVTRGESCANQQFVEVCNSTDLTTVETELGTVNTNLDTANTTLDNIFTEVQRGAACAAPTYVEVCNPTAATDLTNVESKLDDVVAAIQAIDPEIENKLDDANTNLADILTQVQRGVSCANQQFVEVCNPTDLTDTNNKLDVLHTDEALALTMLTNINNEVQRGSICTNPQYVEMCNAITVDTTPIETRLDTANTNLVTLDTDLQAILTEVHRGVDCMNPSFVEICPPAVPLDVNLVSTDITCAAPLPVQICQTDCATDPLLVSLCPGAEYTEIVVEVTSNTTATIGAGAFGYSATLMPNIGATASSDPTYPAGEVRGIVVPAGYTVSMDGDMHTPFSGLTLTAYSNYRWVGVVKN